MSAREATDSRLTLATIHTNLHSSAEVNFRRKTWRKPRSRLEKVLFSLTFGFLLLTIGLAITITVLLIHHIRHGQKRVCQTKGCIDAASTILNNMDPTANPCEDFYQYACGGYEEQILLGEEFSHINSFSSIDKRIQGEMRKLIQQPWKPPEPYYYKLIKDLYVSCMNLTSIEYLGGQPLLTEMRRAGGWPLVEGSSWKPEQFDWKEIAFKFRHMGVYMNFLIDVAVVQDLKNSSRFILQVDQPYLGMPDRSYLVKGLTDPLVQAYYGFSVETAVLLGAERSRAETEMKTSIEFEIEMAKICLPKEDLRNYTKMYNKMTAGELQKLTPQINWVSYFNNLGLPKLVDENEEVIVINPSYVKKFVSLVTSTDKRVVANYVMWRMAKSLLDTLDRRFQHLKTQYNRHITGQAGQVARAYYCSDVIWENMEIAIGAMYIQSPLRPETKAIAKEITREVKSQFYDGFGSVEWLDSETLKRARLKLESMREYIAYPDELLDPEKVNGYYKNLYITTNEYFHNLLRIYKFTTDFYLSRLDQTAEETQWINVGTAATVNAFYKFADNTMVFYAAILNGAFFHPDRPNYLNFGSLGFIVGHEISHGFDDMGRQYDENGNLRNWWTNATDLQFREKATCIIEQYGNYTVPEINMLVNGINTQGENIADVGGIKNSYQAYLKWEKKHEEELPLPGLSFTPRQLFWMSNANVWCSIARPEYLEYEVNTDFHSPSRFRVIGPFSNSPEFAKDFKCPLGSPMNPEKKCSVW